MLRALVRRAPLTAFVAVAAALPAAAPAAAQDTRVSVGSPPAPFSQNKQNEPAVAIDAHDPSVVVAGSNDNIDMEACNAGDPTTCPFTPDVGSDGVYFSFNGGKDWTQPTYSGLTGRDCLGPAECTAHQGPIGTLPRFDEVGLVSDGDPALAFGPRKGADGKFSWANGSRLYYASLASSLSSGPAFKGFEAITVSRTDDPRIAAAGGPAGQAAWKTPVIVSKQSATTFSDKEQVWADNASSSKYFGNAYVCNASFRSNSKGNALPVPLVFARSTDGGDTWTTSQLTKAATNFNDIGRDGCTIRTTSDGVVYVFYRGTDPATKGPAQLVLKSTDGGKHFSGPTAAAPAHAPGVLDPVILRPVMDGLTGARADLSPAPSVDIANGAPSGADATNQIAIAWADRGGGLNAEQGLYTTSRNGSTWTAPKQFSPAGDRPFYVAPAFAPDGSDLYITYDSFTTPYQEDTDTPRNMVAGVLHAEVDRTSGAVSPFTSLHRHDAGDPRGSSQNNLVAEFLGDYVYAAATNDYAVAVWNDDRGAADCPAIDKYRHDVAQAVESGEIPPVAEEDGPAEAHAQAREEAQNKKPGTEEDAGPEPPAVQEECAPNFGNSDIYGGQFADPTP
jgi:hypothetical protein